MDSYPKAVAQSLPKRIRDGNFEDLLEALRVMLIEDS